MLKTLYAVGLALPRIVFQPWREFEVVIPEKGIPFIGEKQVDVDEPLYRHVPILQIRDIPKHKHSSLPSSPIKESDQKKSTYEADRRDEE